MTTEYLVCCRVLKDEGHRYAVWAEGPNGTFTDTFKTNNYTAAVGFLMRTAPQLLEKAKHDRDNPEVAAGPAPSVVVEPAAQAPPAPPAPRPRKGINLTPNDKDVWNGYESWAISELKYQEAQDWAAEGYDVYWVLWEPQSTVKRFALSYDLTHKYLEKLTSPNVHYRVRPGELIDAGVAGVEVLG